MFSRNAILRHHKLFVLMVFALAFCSFSALAQDVRRESISSAGITSYSGNGSLRETIGQPYHTGTYTDNSFSVCPGFQQPLQFTVFEEVMDKIKLDVFPNPATSRVTIRSDELIENATLTLCDVSGKILYSAALNKTFTAEIPCGHLAEGVYLIHIEQKDRFVYDSRLSIIR